MTLVTIDEAARRAVVHPQTVRRWIREGRLKPFRIPDAEGVRVTWLMLASVLEVERDRRRARLAGRHALRGPRLPT